MIKITSLIAVAILLFGHSAQAANINLDVSLNSGTLAYGTGGTYHPDINLNSPAPATLSLTGDAHVISPPISIPNFIARPKGFLFHHEYLGVLNNPGTSGTATFDLASGDNTFAFKWGTIDTYNTLVLKTSDGQTYDITGADILNNLAGKPVAGKTQANVEFYDPFGSIISAELETTQNSFEAANFFEGGSDPTPLPPAALLFGSAVLGLVFFARRRRSS